MAIECRDLTFEYRDKKILNSINFRAKEGEFLSLVGSNGSGKTTILKNLAKILKPNRGEILIYGKNSNKISQKELSKTLSYMPQHQSKLNITALEAIMVGRKPYLNFKFTEADFRVVDKLVKELNLKSLIKKSLLNLSGGEFQKVMIAKSLAQEGKILLLDEPINHLDIKNQIEILNIIKKITKEKKLTTITVLHDLNLALNYSDKILMLKSGENLNIKTPENITSENIFDTFGVKNSIETLSSGKFTIDFS